MEGDQGRSALPLAHRRSRPEAGWECWSSPSRCWKGAKRECVCLCCVGARGARAKRSHTADKTGGHTYTPAAWPQENHTSSSHPSRHHRRRRAHDHFFRHDDRRVVTDRRRLPRVATPLGARAAQDVRRGGALRPRCGVQPLSRQPLSQACHRRVAWQSEHLLIITVIAIILLHCAACQMRQRLRNARRKARPR